MRRLILLFLFFVCINYVFPQNAKLDTVYYDRKGMGVANPVFATYYCVYCADDTINGRSRYRGYFITGELRSEGFLTFLDKANANGTILDGENVIYYKTGNVCAKFSKANGVLVGEYVRYYENGLIAEHCTYKEGKKDGLQTKFNKQGDVCTQIEMYKDKPLFNYEVVSDRNGYSSKIRLSDNMPIFESPKESERKTDYHDGVVREFYTKNGFLVAMTCNTIKDYGNWYQISITIANHSVSSVDFDPGKIAAFIEGKRNGRTYALDVWSSEDYMKKVRRTQNWNSALAGIVEGFAAAGAGYSTSTSTTNTTYDGYSNVYGSASAIGSGGYAYGSYSGNGSYHGNSSSTSTTVSYDGAAAYQAQIIASKRLANYEYSQYQARKVREEGYLKKTTLYPGDAISGYVNIKRDSRSGATLYVYVDIGGAKYKFGWNVSK